MHHHFGITGGLKNRTLLLQPMTDQIGIHQVAVVGQRDHALVAIHHDGLRVQHRRIAGSGVARMANGQPAGKAR